MKPLMPMIRRLVNLIFRPRLVLTLQNSLSTALAPVKGDTLPCLIGIKATPLRWMKMCRRESGGKAWDGIRSPKIILH
ncbi:hypothetical protein F5Y11DRAFT_310506 [Daldinia sp. FL1419]|nr:hypothetical protein F5Y11DRAFT_310506 [Daldinia sp. FL1419]